MATQGVPAKCQGMDKLVCDRYDPDTFGPVCAFTEWDPLEEVIVGVGNNACEPDVNVDPVWRYLFHSEDKQLARRGPYPKDLIEAGTRELDNLTRVLQNEGVTVRRPEPAAFEEPFNAPGAFKVPCGFNATCPRDILMTLGNTLIEAPMGLRTRFFEYQCYRPLIQEYFMGGANWVAAPKGVMKDNLFDASYPVDDKSAARKERITNHEYVTTEAEPIWDAADWMRMGKDIFAQRSFVSNEFGIEWFRRTFTPQGYRVHTLHSEDIVPKHIDCTLLPLRPGLALENPTRKMEERNLFLENDWRLLTSVEPTPLPDKWVKTVIRPTSHWIGINIFSIDDRRIVASSHEKDVIKQLESVGAKVIPVPFQAMFYLGGAFHCATTDVRRRGDRRSYFPQLDEKDEERAECLKYSDFVGHTPITPVH
eukprot:TRINITY_DN51590_c0_g1_i1.p1 TRINITY_DN51590_c0_g1~~TRINITY_DN51590_c0_g1_i1.p1  ORF type:complete len:422 (+),score=180.25 TRINITY_DN51590_c0_g1_i1:140-1405(+)